MKRTFVLTSLAVSLVAFAPATFAQTPAPAAAPVAAPAAAAAPAPAADAPGKLTKVEDHIKALHKGLGITADQQPKFDVFAQAMRDQAQAMYTARENRVDAVLSAPDEMQRYADLAQAHADSAKALVPAFRTLYDSLSDAQKKKADKMFAHPHSKK
jgi:molecular chaperone GrpE (heat shock protein)